jgi:anti-anti-sigma regulatory factor
MRGQAVPARRSTGAATEPPVVRLSLLGSSDRDVVVEVLADLDLASRSRAQAELHALLDMTAPRPPILDTRRVFIDVIGLGVLCEVAARARRSGRLLRLQATPVVRRMSPALGLDDQLALAPEPPTEVGPGPADNAVLRVRSNH